MTTTTPRLIDLSAFIRTGRTFRETPTSSAPDAIRVLTYKDLMDQRLLGQKEAETEGVLGQCDAVEAWAGELLQPGDILFAGKGGRCQAYLFDLPERTIAGSLFVVIRTKADVLDPGYLLWFLNSPAAQAHFKASMVGTLVPNVPLSALKDLIIPVPPLIRQRLIARVHELAIQEEHILNELGQQRKVLVEQILNNATT